MKTFIIRDSQENSLAQVHQVLDLLVGMGFALNLGAALMVDARDEGTATLVGDLLEKSGQRFNLLEPEAVKTTGTAERKTRAARAETTHQPAAERLPAVERLPALYPRHCEACGAEFTPKRKDSFYCGREDCQKARAQRNMARFKQSKSEDQAEDPADDAPVDPAATAVVECWSIQSGPRMGQRLTTSQMATALQLRDLDEGTAVEHQKRGAFVVILRENGTLTMARARSNGHG